HGNLWFSRKIVQVRRAPDRRADAPMDVDAGIDGDHADGAGLLELQHLVRKGKAFGDHDLAADPLAAGKILGLVAVEQVADALRIGRWHIDKLAGKAAGHAGGISRRLRAKNLSIGFDGSFERDAEVDLRLEHRYRDAMAPQ